MEFLGGIAERAGEPGGLSDAVPVSDGDTGVVDQAIQKFTAVGIIAPEERDLAELVLVVAVHGDSVPAGLVGPALDRDGNYIGRTVATLHLHLGTCTLKG